MDRAKEQFRGYQRKEHMYRTNEYTARVDCMIQKIVQEIYQSKCAKTVSLPLFQIFKTAAQKLFLNQLQLTFLSNSVGELRQKLEEGGTKEWANELRMMVKCQDSKEVQFCRQFQLNLIFQCYSLKLNLSEEEDSLRLIEAELERYLPRFKERFNIWNRQSARLHKKINQKTLKSQFEMLKSTHNLPLNYNTLVESILSISPPYNSDKSAHRQEPLRRSRSRDRHSRSKSPVREPILTRPAQEHRTKQESSVPTLMLKKSSQYDGNNDFMDRFLERQISEDDLALALRHSQAPNFKRNDSVSDFMKL